MNQKISHYFKIKIFVKLSEDKAQTMEAKSQKGLYFIEEVIDVTGHLGEYNFQWAWSSVLFLDKMSEDFAGIIY